MPGEFFAEFPPIQLQTIVYIFPESDDTVQRKGKESTRLDDRLTSLKTRSEHGL